MSKNPNQGWDYNDLYTLMFSSFKDYEEMWGFTWKMGFLPCYSSISMHRFNPWLWKEELLNCQCCFLQVKGIKKYWDYRSAQSWACDMGCLHVNSSETKRLPSGPWQYFLIGICTINLYTTIASRLRDKIYRAVNHSGNFTLCFLSRACAVYNCCFLI